MSFGNWLSNAARDVGRVASGAVRTVNRAANDVSKAVSRNPIAKLADNAAKEASKAMRVPQQVLRMVTDSPVYQLVASGVSYIPGWGQVVGAGMGALAAIGQGAGLQDLALRAARGALPGQPASGIAFDIAVGLLLKKEKLDATALKLARDRVPGGQYGKAAFDAAVNLLLGRSHNLADSALRTARNFIPKHPAAQAAFDLGAGIARGKTVPQQMIAAVRKRVPGGVLGQAVFDTAVLAARPGQASKEVLKVYAQRIAPLGVAGKVLGKAVGSANNVHRKRMQVFQALAALRTAGAFVRKVDLHDPAAKAQFVALMQQAQRGNPRAAALVKVLGIARQAWRTHPQLMQGATSARGAVAGAWPPERIIMRSRHRPPAQPVPSSASVPPSTPAPTPPPPAPPTPPVPPTPPAPPPQAAMPSQGATAWAAAPPSPPPQPNPFAASSLSPIAGDAFESGYAGDLVGQWDALFHRPYRTSAEALTPRDAYTLGADAIVRSTDKTTPWVGNRFFRRQHQ